MGFWDTVANVATGGVYGAGKAVVNAARPQPGTSFGQNATHFVDNIFTGGSLTSHDGQSGWNNSNNGQNPAGGPVQMPTFNEPLPQYQAFTGKAGWEAGTDNPWTQMMRQQNQQQHTQDQDMLRRQTQGQTATAMDQLAMQGGLAGGAGERLQSRAARGLTGGMATLAGDLGKRNLEIGTTGAQQNLDLSKFNTELGFRDNTAQNSSALDAWKTKAGIWAAANYANQTDPRNNDDGRRWYDPSSWVNPTPPPGVNYLPVEQTTRRSAYGPGLNPRNSI